MSTVRVTVPRLPDAAAWAIAASPSLGITEQEICAALSPPAPSSPSTSLDTALSTFVDDHPDWTGTATDLTKALDLPEPMAPKALSQRLGKTAPALGIHLHFTRTDTRRVITLRKPLSAQCHSVLPDLHNICGAGRPT